MQPSSLSSSSKQKSFHPQETKQKSYPVSDEELRLAFDALGGKDGILTVETFAQKAKDFRIHNFREIIGDTGQISFNELKTLLSAHENLLTDDPAEQCMKFFDPLNSGYVDVKLLKSSLENVFHLEITDEELDTIIRVLDSDGDGKLSALDWNQAIERLFVVDYFLFELLFLVIFLVTDDLK